MLTSHCSTACVIMHTSMHLCEWDPKKVFACFEACASHWCWDCHIRAFGCSPLGEQCRSLLLSGNAISDSTTFSFCCFFVIHSVPCRTWQTFPTSTVLKWIRRHSYITVICIRMWLHKAGFTYVRIGCVSLHPICRTCKCNCLSMERVHTGLGQLRSTFQKGPVRVQVRFRCEFRQKFMADIHLNWWSEAKPDPMLWADLRG